MYMYSTADEALAVHNACTAHKAKRGLDLSTATGQEKQCELDLCNKRHKRSMSQLPPAASPSHNKQHQHQKGSRSALSVSVCQPTEGQNKRCSNNQAGGRPPIIQNTTHTAAEVAAGMGNASMQQTVSHCTEVSELALVRIPSAAEPFLLPAAANTAHPEFAAASADIAAWKVAVAAVANLAPPAADAASARAGCEAVSTTVTEGRYEGLEVQVTKPIDPAYNGKKIVLKRQLGEGGFSRVYEGVVVDTSLGELAVSALAPGSKPVAVAVKIFLPGILEGANSDAEMWGRQICKKYTAIELRLLELLRGQKHAVQLLVVGQLDCNVPTCKGLQPAAAQEAQRSSSGSAAVVQQQQLQCAVLPLLHPLREVTKLSHHKVRQVTRSVLQVLQFMHSGRLGGSKFQAYHRDIKAANILTNAELTAVYLSDFGSAIILDKDAASYGHTKIGTPFSMWPEISKKHQHAALLAQQQTVCNQQELYAVTSYDCGRADMWSVGTLVFELYAGSARMARFMQAPEFVTCDPEEYCTNLVTRFVDGKLDFAHKCNAEHEDVRDFVAGCCGIHGITLTVDQAAQHPFLQSVTSSKAMMNAGVAE